ncbi:MAG: hypothetical protein Q9209_000849 [Squamulea sp. 1 TL-2023]
MTTSPSLIPTSSPTTKPTPQVHVTNISTLVILLYIATPCVLTLFLLPLFAWYIIRKVRKQRKIQELQELEETRRKQLVDILSAAGTGRAEKIGRIV